jgi:exonuclease III
MPSRSYELKHHTIRIYSAHINLGSEGKGTAILIKDSHTLTDIEYMPTGRGITVLFNGVKILKVYVLSGSNKNDREAFYNMDIPRLLIHPTTNLLMAGDFNCVLTNTDCT